MNIQELLNFSVKSKASDMHLSAGMPPLIRVDGDIRRIDVPSLDHKAVHGLIYEIMNDKQRKDYEEFLETDFSFEVPGVARFRVNAFNRSNSNTVKENAGPFTQGAGLSYHEDFNSAKDFVLLQSFLDVFRSKENKVVKFKRKKRQTKLPPVGAPTDPTPSIENKEENE